MSNAIRVVVNSTVPDVNVLTMVVQENYDIYRGTQLLIQMAINLRTGIDIDEDQLTQAIYDSRMKGESIIVLNNYQIHLKSGVKGI